jgi:uncharacterized protein YeaO (DUF488 family)
MIRLKRAYEEPREEDGRRYLIDRLWPRGLSKSSLKIDGWLKEAAPSQELRRWFQHDPAKWDEFRRRYCDELDAKPEAWMALVDAARQGPITLIYSARDAEHNNGIVLAEYLAQKMKSHPRGKR